MLRYLIRSFFLYLIAILVSSCADEKGIRLPENGITKIVLDSERNLVVNSDNEELFYEILDSFRSSKRINFLGSYLEPTEKIIFVSAEESYVFKVSAPVGKDVWAPIIESDGHFYGVDGEIKLRGVLKEWAMQYDHGHILEKQNERSKPLIN
jgi:hypothetical protein